MEIATYELKITFDSELLGSQPQRDVAEEYLHGKAVEAGIELEDELESLPEELEKGTTAFHKMNGQPVLYDYMLRGFLKEAGRVLATAVGVKQLRSKIDNLVFVRPRVITLEVPAGGELTHLARPLRAQTAQGPRTAIARSEMLPAGTRFTCRLRVYPGEVSETVLRQLLDYGQDKGMGQWRNGGFGAFTYELTLAS